MTCRKATAGVTWTGRTGAGSSAGLAADVGGACAARLKSRTPAARNRNSSSASRSLGILAVESALGVYIELAGNLGEELRARSRERLLDSRRDVHRGRHVPGIRGDELLDRLLRLVGAAERDQAERPVLLHFERCVGALKPRKHGQCILVGRRGIEIFGCLKQFLTAGGS
jgi:hypothetical protein